MAVPPLIEAYRPVLWHGTALPLEGIQPFQQVLIQQTFPGNDLIFTTSEQCHTNWHGTGYPKPKTWWL